MILVHKGNRVTVKSGIMHKTKGEYIPVFVHCEINAPRQ